jgi:hypothetical protein
MTEEKLNIIDNKVTAILSMINSFTLDNMQENSNSDKVAVETMLEKAEFSNEQVKEIIEKQDDEFMNIVEDIIND